LNLPELESTLRTDMRRRSRLRPGDVVEVRSSAEILATLNGDGSVEGMPFMPEMLRHVGKRFTVSHRVEKICDTISGSHGSRRMRNTVFLEDLRCDGSGHGGCQAGCRIYWKEAWLRRVDPDVAVTGEDNGSIELHQIAQRSARAEREIDGAVRDVYRCQATEALRATEPLSRFDASQYLRELASGNVRASHLLRVVGHALSRSARRRLRRSVGALARALRIPVPRRFRRSDYPLFPHHAPTETPVVAPSLWPGEMVEVRSHEEIKRTLDEHSRNRGLWFDPEMTPYCGGRYRVQDRVQRIINERNGCMIELSNDCLILEGVVCRGEHSPGRWFCPRAIYSYWREAWLLPVADSDPSAPRDAPVLSTDA
jgi:hypothetical protein